MERDTTAYLISVAKICNKKTRFSGKVGDRHAMIGGQTRCWVETDLPTFQSRVKRLYDLLCQSVRASPLAFWALTGVSTLLLLPKCLGKPFLPVMAAVAVRKEVVSIDHFSPSFCFQSLQIFLFVKSNQKQLYVLIALSKMS